ncbi:PqqD family protein [Ferruginivarius sediminum]|uniref:PqqD family protein n=1 Tax=Ferruginivarius sediminum TaxID=2661937 RepID=A0A369T4Y2_9PROT|nr:PqqD family protein [Ferruginivarius sediminum]RDD60379.1 PqqD family protein [Ferruginivarius sediminum]
MSEDTYANRISPAACLRRNPDVRETPVDDDIFLVAPDSDDIVYLDRIGTAIWKLLEAPHTQEDVRAVFHDAFPDVPPARIDTDLNNALQDLLARGLIVVDRTG